ncbi:MAG TPA: hypothetical protein VH041_17420, partial [Caldimonas sp.]
MRLSPAWTGPLVAGLILLAGVATCARATPITPTSDDEVIEVLPATSATRNEDRQLRKRLAEHPHEAPLATAVAQRYLEQARESGDPRFAGLALAALRAWPDPATAPSGVLFLRATLEQYLHEFDASVAHLRILLARPGGERNAQAWLTLATVLRVQARYLESDAACGEVGRAGADVYAAACVAENAALRGETAAARRSFHGLLADTRLAPSTRGWLLTSLAELEERDGRPAAADAAYRAVLRLDPDTYSAVAYADFLIAQKRPAEALAVLKGETRTDPVLLRLAIAGTQANAPSHERDVAEMRDRITLANERPEARIFHGREQAMFALAIDH